MRVAEPYPVMALPATFLVDQRGDVRASACGPRDWDLAPAPPSSKRWWAHRQRRPDHPTQNRRANDTAEAVKGP